MNYPQKYSIIEILTISPVLGKIVNKVEQLAKLNRTVLQTLDPKLRKHCRVANLREGVLILTTSSPASGHLLRYAAIDLLTNLRTDPEWCHLKSIKIHVRPKENNPTPSLAIFPKPTLSQCSMDAIKNTAFNIQSPSLQKALLKLAKRQ